MMGTYLVQYGKPAFVGCFHSPGREFGRGDGVVFRGPRGVELGTLLCEPAEPFIPAAPVDGEILRAATLADFARAKRHEALAADVLTAADARAIDDGLTLSLIDIEISLDGAFAILHALPWSECDATSLLDDLSTRFGLSVRLLDLSRMPKAGEAPANAGCGKPGCGSQSGGCDSCGSGGCSTGSCSRGQVKTADDLTAYFASLRRDMESRHADRTPLA